MSINLNIIIKMKIKINFKVYTRYFTSADIKRIIILTIYFTLLGIVRYLLDV